MGGKENGEGLLGGITLPRSFPSTTFTTHIHMYEGRRRQGQGMAGSTRPSVHIDSTWMEMGKRMSATGGANTGCVRGRAALFLSRSR